MDIQPVINRIASGDREAFRLIVERYQKPLFGFLSRMGVPAATADELAQETFLRVWQQLHRFDPDKAAFTTWVYTIARNLALNELQRKTPETLENPDHAAQIDGAGPDRQMEDNEMQQRVSTALMQLSLAERTTLALACIGDLDTDAAAKLEHCSVGTFRTRLHRARHKLRELLSGDES